MAPSPTTIPSLLHGARPTRRGGAPRTRWASAFLGPAVLLVLLTGCTKDSAAPARELTGYTRQPVPSVKGVSLPRADGAGDWSMTAPAGGLRLVFFGYTSCPDVCPTTMSDLKRGLLSLPKGDRARVGVAMVTIDPDRDTAAKLTDYVTTFIPDAVGLRTTDAAALSRAAAPFGATYSVKPGKDGTPEVSHSGDLYAVNDRGRVVLQWPFGTTAKDLGADLAQLLERTGDTTSSPGS